MYFFDYTQIAQEAGLLEDSLDALATRMRREFPKDEMMFELHMLRACMAVRDGHVSLADILADEAASTR